MKIYKFVYNVIILKIIYTDNLDIRKEILFLLIHNFKKYKIYIFKVIEIIFVYLSIFLDDYI